MDTDPAREEHGGERVSGSGLVGFEQENEEKSSSVLKFSVQWGVLKKHLDERAMEIEDTKKWVTEREGEIETKLPLESSLTKNKEEVTKELETKEKGIDLKQKEEAMEMDLKKSLLARIVELEKKEELFGKVELRENSINVKEKEIEMKLKEKEEAMEELEAKKREIALKLKEWTEKRRENAEKVKESLMELVEKEKVLRSRDKTITEKETEMNKKEDIFKEMESESKILELKQRELEAKEKELKEKSNDVEKKEEILKAKAQEMEWKSKFLELREKSLEETAIDISEKEKLVTERLKEIEERESKVALRESTIAEEKEKENESGVKEKLAMELRLREVEERKKKVGLLEDSLKEKEREMEAKESAMRLAIEKEKEEAMKMVEDKEKEVELLSKLTNEKSCQLESKGEQFEVKQIVATERNKKDAAEIEMKIKLLELKEKEVEEKVKELEFLKQKNMELGEGSIRAEAESSKKRSRAEDTLIGCAAKKHNHDGKDKEIESSPEEDVNIKGDVSTEQPVAITCVVESEFNSFKKTINSFKVNQLWAVYDHRIDGMPRLYGRIKAIVKSQSCIKVKWLNPKESVHVPIACGRYQYGEKGSKDLLAFSHEMQGSIVRGNNFTAVYPKKGEIWALFRDWNKSWNNNNNQLHKPPYNYDFAEILLEFDAHLGLAGVYLEKVDGFVSVFKHSKQQQRLVTRIVPADEMNRFSHKVPSFRLSGEEKQGVPVGSFELDPTAVPSFILKRLDNKEPKKEGMERQSEEEGVEAAAGHNGTTIDVPIILD